MSRRIQAWTCAGILALVALIIYLKQETPLPTPHLVLGHAHGVQSCDFSPDGKLLASGSMDGTIRLWQVRDGMPAGILRRHTSGVKCVRFLPDGNHLVSSSYWGKDYEGGQVLVWDVSKGGIERSIDVCSKGEMASSLAVSPDGKILLAGVDVRGASRERGRTEVINLATGGRQASLDSIQRGVTCVAFSPDGIRAAIGDDWGGISLRNTQTWEQLALTEGYGNSCTLVFSPDGTQLAAGGIRSPITLRDSKALEVKAEMGAAKDKVFSLVFARNGESLFAGTGVFEGTVRVFDLTRQRKHRSFKAHRGSIECVALSPDGRLLATASSDFTVKLWRTDVDY